MPTEEETLYPLMVTQKGAFYRNRRIGLAKSAKETTLEQRQLAAFEG